MNSINQGDQKLTELLMGNQKAVANSLSELFVQATICGYLTHVDRYGLMVAFSKASLSDEEQAAIDRLFYAVRRGRIRFVDENSAKA